MCTIQSQNLKAYIKGLVVLLLFLSAFLIRTNGIEWEKFHPDEIQISEWIKNSEGKISWCERVYPNGFFILIKPYIAIKHLLFTLSQNWSNFLNPQNTTIAYNPDFIILGRWFNVWLGIILLLVFFIALLHNTNSLLSTIIATAFLAFHPIIIEHNRYAETDIAALFTLTVFLFLMLLSIKKKSKRYLYLACFTAGFAAGTKFILFLLLFIISFETFKYGYLKNSSRKFLNGIIQLLFGTFLFVIGLIASNPDIIIRPGWFFEGLSYEKWRVQHETITIFDESLSQGKYVVYLHNLKKFYEFTYRWNIPVVFLILFTYRQFKYLKPYFSILIIFPLAFMAYWIFLSPFVRSQEVIIILPFVAIFLAMAITLIWQERGIFSKSATAIVVALIISICIRDALLISKTFAWKDTRTLANEWLSLCAPKNVRWGAEQYARHALKNRLLSYIIDKIEKYDFSIAITNQMDYFIRAPFIGGRGIRNPFTTELYCYAAANYAHFATNTTLIAKWSLLTYKPATTFVSPLLELYGCKKLNSNILLNFEFPQPAAVLNINQQPVKNVTFFKDTSKIGPAIALLIDKTPQTIGIGGPLNEGDDIYVVLTTMERNATIKVEGFGKYHYVTLAPYDVGIVQLKNDVSFFGKSPFQPITVYAETKKDISYIPVFLRIAFFPEQVYEICLEHRRPERIPATLLDEKTISNLPYNIQFELTMNNKTYSYQNKLFERMKINLEQAINSSSEEILVNKISGYYFGQFARIDLLRILANKNDGYRIYEFEHNEPKLISFLKLPIEKSTNTNAAIASLQLPVLLAKGVYTLTGSILLSTIANNNLPLKIQFNGTRNQTTEILCESGKWQTFSIDFKTQRANYPSIQFQYPEDTRLYIKELELHWNISNMVNFLYSDLIRAKQSAQQNNSTSDKDQFSFLPWIRFASFNFDEKSYRIECVFDLISDDPPPLALAIYVKKGSKWRYKEKVSIQIPSNSMVGDKIQCDINLKKYILELAKYDISRIGLGIASDVEWHPGKFITATSNQAIAIPDLIAKLKK